MRVRGKRASLLGPLILVVAGVALLLNNFLLLSGFNLTALWPLLLVIAGAWILLRGDLLPAAEPRPFGITRGGVEAATVEVSAGEIDVTVRALQREGRLIAGQFAADSRPELHVQDAHAYLRLDRVATPWLSFSDWDMGLSPDLPWDVYVSTSLGQVRLDLAELAITDATIATGLGDIRLVVPRAASAPLRLQSALGDIHVQTPEGSAARVTVRAGRLFGLHVDETRYEEIAPGQYQSRYPDDDAPLVELHVAGTFGDAYLT